MNRMAPSPISWSLLTTLITGSLLVNLCGRPAVAQPIDSELPPAVFAADDESRPVIPPAVAEQIQLLGDERFPVRERATSRLIELGAVAVPALERARSHNDREIRYRAERILTLVLKNDFQRRLEAFAADTRSNADYGLPGWPEFRQLAGDSPGARALFVEMVRCEPDLFLALQEGTKPAVAALEARVLELQLEQYQDRGLAAEPPNVGHNAAMLFIIGRPDAQVPDHILRFTLDACRQTRFDRALNEGNYQKPLKQLVAKAVETATDFAAGPAINMAMRYDLKEGIVPAARLLRGGQNVLLPSDRPVAILAVGRFGDISHAPLLESLLTDETPFLQNQVIERQATETQIRDLALAALWKLHGEDPRTHGFSEQLRDDPQLLFVPQTLGFASDEQRVRALAEWQRFREARNGSPQNSPRPDR